jgi:hypothetical protein
MPTTTNLAIYCAIFNGNTQLSRVLVGEPIYFLSYLLGPVRLQYNVSIRLHRQWGLSYQVCSPTTGQERERELSGQLHARALSCVPWRSRQ